MPIGLLGKKLGHTRVYDANGVLIPVTVVLAGPNRVLQVKTQAGKDGYNSVQLGFDDQKEQRVTKPLLGHIKKQKGVAVKRIREFRDFSLDVKSGDIVGPTIFAAVIPRTARRAFIAATEPSASACSPARLCAA